MFLRSRFGGEGAGKLNSGGGAFPPAGDFDTVVAEPEAWLGSSIDLISGVLVWIEGTEVVKGRNGVGSCSFEFESEFWNRSDGGFEGVGKA